MTATVVRRSVLLSALLLAAPVVCAEQAPADGPKARFSALDVNGDGVVSRYEYDGDAAFAAIDANGDKRISAEELATFLGDASPAGPTAAERIVVADLDADGALDQDEVYRAVEMRFEALDRNGDGNLEHEEFAAGFGVRAR